jgi:hypothetical protein
MFDEKMLSPKTPKNSSKKKIEFERKIKIIEDSKKPGFDKAKIMK